LSETLRRLLSVGDKFPTVSFGGARMTTSAVGVLQARSRDQGLVFEENECCCCKEGEGRGVLPLVFEGRVSDVRWRLSEESIEDLKILDRISKLASFLRAKSI
jgi:hypothetical protein